MMVPVGFTPRPCQLEWMAALDSGDVKKVLLIWHRQLGKDTGAFAYMCKEAVRRPGNYFYVFPTKEEGRKALWEKYDPNLKRKILDFMPKHLLVGNKPNNQEMLLKLKNGATIRIIGLDKNPDGVRGVSATGIVFSEFAFSDFDAYKAALPALRQTKGWLLINSTPMGRNHFYDMYKRALRSKDWFVSFKQTLYPESEGYTGEVTPEEIQKIADDDGLSQEDVEREFGCSFSTGAKGAFYADQVERANKEDRVGFYDYDPYYPVDTFWDLGRSDDTVCWFRQIIGNRIYWIDYWAGSNQDPKDLAEMLYNRGYFYREIWLPHDADHLRQGMPASIRTQLEDGLLKYNIQAEIAVVPKCNNIMPGIYTVRKRFPRYYFNIGSAGVKEGLNLLELYRRQYDRKTRMFKEMAVHDKASHTADAIRMEAESESYQSQTFDEEYIPQDQEDIDPYF